MQCLGTQLFFVTSESEPIKMWTPFVDIKMFLHVKTKSTKLRIRANTHQVTLIFKCHGEVKEWRTPEISNSTMQKSGGS